MTTTGRAVVVTSVLLSVVVPGVPAPAWGQEDDDKGNDEAPPPPRSRARGKLVAFDQQWLEPFFKSEKAKRAAEKFREEDWDAAEAGFAKALKGGVEAGAEHSAALYLQALARANQSKWAEAGATFEELYTKYPRLGPYHAYNAARCRLRRGDAAGALEWAGRVAKGTLPEAETHLVRIDALRALNRWEDAFAAINSYSERFPSGPRRAEVMFKKGEAVERIAASRPDVSGAYAEIVADVTALYRRVWAEAPLEPWGERAGERITALAQALPLFEANLVRTRTASEWFTRGMAWFDKNRNTESETAFGSALAAPGLDRELECRARYYRAQSVWKQRQRARAAPLFDEAEVACKVAPIPDLHAKSLYQAGRCFGAMTFQAGLDEARVKQIRASALERFARLENEHRDHSYADDARVRAAELTVDGGDEEAATKLLAEVPTLYPKGDLVNEALWRLAFGAWRNGRYGDALTWLDENLRLIPREEIWYAEGRAQYWKARVFEKQGRTDEARAWYERAVREYPLSVYALLSLARMRESFPRAREALVASLRESKPKPVRWTFPARTLFGDPAFQRAVELARMGLGGDARRELARLGLSTAGEKQSGGRTGDRDGDNEDEDLLWITTILLDRGGIWSASHSIPRYTLTRYRSEYPRQLGAAKWKLSYPRAFPVLVSKNSKANQVPEALQLAIMREESAFSPRIESFANAIGLTQMLIKTAQRFAGRATVNREALMDPAKNLEYGSRFLGFLWKRFDGAAPLTIASYNAGEGAVESWLALRHDLAMDEFMESIRVDETRNYTKRVLASYFAYSWLYTDHPIPEIPLALPPRQARTADKRG
ncbi:MAG TPA: transglycosylase SLT domain-containing protein [Polyangia bacterium]|nr:transglycosylase SLT domain-containing protein [Polyangia bacterium]